MRRPGFEAYLRHRKDQPTPQIRDRDSELAAFPQASPVWLDAYDRLFTRTSGQALRPSIDDEQPVPPHAPPHGFPVNYPHDSWADAS